MSPRPELLTSPGTVLAGVLAIWVFVPANVVRPKIGVALLLLVLAWVWGSACRHATRLRWTPAAALVLLSGCVAVLSTPWYGSSGDLLAGLGSTALLTGCMLLASYCDAVEVRRLVTVLVALGVIEACFAAASVLLGVPAPWGYLGAHGAVFGVNELLPALPGRATGTMGHPLPFGTLEAAGAVLALFAARHWPVVLRVAAVAACGAGVVLSGSRSAAFVLVAVAVIGALRPGASGTTVVPRLLLAAGIVVAVCAVDVSGLTAVSSLAGTGSLTHRVAALESFGRLAGRPVTQVLFGSGEGSLDSLFAQGLLQQDGFFAVDDQLVTTFALAGAVGLAAVLAAMLAGLLRGHRPTRPAALVPALMFLSFDVLQWTATALLFGVLLALGTGRDRSSSPDTAEAGDPGSGSGCPAPSGAGETGEDRLQVVGARPTAP